MKLTFVNYSFVGNVHHFNSSRKPIGGGEVYLADLCRVLKAEGFEPRVLQGGREAGEFEFQGIPVRQVATRGRYWFNFDWPKAVRVGDGVIHLHDANHAFPLASGNTATFHGVSWDVPFQGGDPL
ncbi:MAG: hypothetical protein AABW54_00280, partial [Candidatus Micrarchaeota archaeon]